VQKLYIVVLYTSDNQAAAHALAASLTQPAYEIDLAADRPDDALWPQQQLLGANVVIPLLSSASVASPSFIRACQRATHLGRLVVPVLIQSCPIPRPLRAIQYLDAISGIPKIVPNLQTILQNADRLTEQIIRQRRNAALQRRARRLGLLVIVLIFAGGSGFYIWNATQHQHLVHPVTPPVILPLNTVPPFPTFPIPTPNIPTIVPATIVPTH